MTEVNAAADRRSLGCVVQKNQPPQGRDTKMIRSYGSGKPSTGSAGRMPSRGAVLFPLRVASSIAMSIMMRRHPAVFERLSGLDQPTFLIEPRELPFGFLLHAGGARPRLEIVADPSVMRPTARIRGSLRALIELLEGSLDGDALFFSRELAVEGSTEAVVALRNAVDGAGVDVVADLLSILGPLSKPAQVIVRATGSAGVGIFRLLDAVRNIAMAPAARRLDSHDAKLSDIERRLAPLESRGHLRRRAPG